MLASLARGQALPKPRLAYGERGPGGLLAVRGAGCWWFAGSAAFVCWASVLPGARFKRSRAAAWKRPVRTVEWKAHGRYEHEKFDFLGYSFRPRRVKNRWGKCFIGFTPGVSNEAATKMRQTMRRWRLSRRSDLAIEVLARMWNPVHRGWIQYYGKFYKSALYPVFRHLNRTLARWANRKFKRLRRHRRRAEHWLGGVARREPQLFAHWQLLGLKPAAG